MVTLFAVHLVLTVDFAKSTESDSLCALSLCHKLDALRTWKGHKEGQRGAADLETSAG